MKNESRNNFNRQTPQAPIPQAPRVINGFKIPEWWECQWRRVSCRKMACRFCGRLNALKHLTDEMDRADPEADDAARGQLQETLRYQAKDAGIPEEYLIGGAREITEDDFDENDNLIDEDEHEEYLGNHPPNAESFLLYRLLKRWSRPILWAMNAAEKRGEAWVKTEASEDLAWYATLLPSKVYRQLSTRYETRHAPEAERAEAEEFADIELGYTGYVLRESMRIIDSSLETLARGEIDAHPDPAQVKEAQRRFRCLKSFIEDIARP